MKPNTNFPQPGPLTRQKSRHFWLIENEKDELLKDSGLILDYQTVDDLGFLEKQEKVKKEDIEKKGLDFQNEKNQLLWKLMSAYLDSNPTCIQRQIVNHIEYTIARSRFNFDIFGAYLATSYSVRDRLIELWNDTQQHYHHVYAKQVYYFSVEFLLGRFLQNAILNLNLDSNYRDALKGLGYTMEEIYEQEYDPALGNGGLGRLAACMLDSLSSQNYPCWGYGLRYNYGMFKQEIDDDGKQIEKVDYWLTHGAPWQIENMLIQIPVHFYGHVISIENKRKWVSELTVIAQANDIFIPGYGTDNTNTLRLWSSKPSTEFDLGRFNQGDYYSALSQKQLSENLTSVLYPDDSTDEGRKLRLQQEYFLSSASMKDIIRRVTKSYKMPITDVPKLCAIQLNDTHPAIAIPELMRILIDEYDVKWDQAWDITTQTFAYTNHTILPEALEKWDIEYFQTLFPRHMEIIFEINWKFLEFVKSKFPNDNDRYSRMSLIEEGFVKRVRMSHLAIVGSHAVNGVAGIHTKILESTLFKDFYELWPEKFLNVTNGVTPRRWLNQANPLLAEAITKRLGTSDWITNLNLLEKLRNFADDQEFQTQFAQIKMENKKRLREYIKKTMNIKIPINALYDIHIKRIHLYKRQLLNILSVIYRYLTITKMKKEDREKIVKRVVIFAGKSAPAYKEAKAVVHLINRVSYVINNDPTIGDALKVVFVPNYGVSLAELLIPAADISQQVSTAGTEASGTGNMKFVLNGAPILGTLDGANIEIAECVGKENMFIFGMNVEQVNKARIENANKGTSHVITRELKSVIAAIKGGLFGNYLDFSIIIDPLLSSDFFCVSNDFDDYLKTQEKVDQTFMNKKKWNKMGIMNIAGSGFFSIDRTINEYAKKIWSVSPQPLPPMNEDDIEVKQPMRRDIDTSPRLNSPTDSDPNSGGKSSSYRRVHLSTSLSRTPDSSVLSDDNKSDPEKKSLESRRHQTPILGTKEGFNTN
ncbi:glycogen phosphorylase [Anaeramoeba ignava]|uniref:Alpha-1,4 glucan phosphorylase n=1 Tax=Anaeramoeba ignava TaxID=1746090 RepID=A0A9Q0R638_ANAIG|nr:glycogen phosphorylase [Anaeramoeba ignava]|eukprot:Anaeramoba_ignava/a347361_165.p1 GENE.a347361_165~~a347361_165.p1  ORF type:complete len:984 (-),score=286.71 a347361_165:152-3103(-)